MSFSRRRAIALAPALVAALTLPLAACSGGSSGSASDASSGAASAASAAQSQSSTARAVVGDARTAVPSASPDAAGSALLTATPKQVPPSASTRMAKVDLITGRLSPKSVVANGHGAVIANNMMYNHTTTVYDAAHRRLVATVDDGLRLADFGISGHEGISRGAPVEASFTKDGRYAYVSNYAMHGAGFSAEPTDGCTPSPKHSNSYLYRLDLTTQKVDQVIEVGAVPKYVAVTPDQKHVLVSNWCSYTLSVVDVAAKKTVATVPIGPFPRGIAVAPDSRTAYVTAMGTRDVYAVDLTTMTTRRLASPGRRVRHVAISPDGRALYAVSSGNNNGDGTTNVAKIDTRTGRILATVVPGREPRTMALSADGTAAYVVNYEESTLAKIRTDTMQVVQKVPTGPHPIGATYEPTTGTVWVASYAGSLLVLDDTRPAS